MSARKVRGVGRLKDATCDDNPSRAHFGHLTILRSRKPTAHSPIAASASAPGSGVWCAPAGGGPGSPAGPPNPARAARSMSTSVGSVDSGSAPASVLAGAAAPAEAGAGQKAELASQCPAGVTATCESLVPAAL